MAIWILHEDSKQPKAVESVEHNHPGNNLPHTHDTHTAHLQTQMSMQPQPPHTTTQTPHMSHTHTQDYISEAHYNLQIELHGIAKLHLHLLDLLLLRTLQHTLTPLVTHTVLGPPMRTPPTATCPKTATNGHSMSMLENSAAPSRSSSMEPTEHSSTTWEPSINGYSIFVSSYHPAKALSSTLTTWLCAQYIISSATISNH